jgi:hypothetical protein
MDTSNQHTFPWIPERYIRDRSAQTEAESTSHVKVGSNISTVALQVVGGDEKGTQCLGL